MINGKNNSMRPNAKCPNCGVDMFIAGRYQRTMFYEGKTNLPTQTCLKCNENVHPKDRGEEQEHANTS